MTEEPELPIVELERRARVADHAIDAAWLQSSEEGRVRMRALAKNGSMPSWPGATSASARRRAAEHAELAALLIEYARVVSPHVRPADLERWRSLLSEERRRRGDGLLFNALRQSTVGAVSLYLEFGRLSDGLRRAVCDCGYARDGTVPDRFCDDCDEEILGQWVAEERRILRSSPAYAEEVTAVIIRAAARQSAAIEAPGESAFSDAQGVRRTAGRATRRLARRHRHELEPSDRWRELADLSARSMTTAVRLDAKKAGRRGLGAAGLAELGVRGNEEIWKSANSRVNARTGR